MRGGDKLLEEIDGVALVRRQTERARAATEGHVIVALPPRPHPRFDKLDGLNVVALPVAQATEGISASLKAGLAALPDGTPAVLIVLADLPNITTEDMAQMLAVDLSSPTLVWRGADIQGRRGHPILIQAALFAHFQTLTGDAGGQSVLSQFADQTEMVPLPDDHATRDLDTPEDWAKWRAERA